MIMPLTKVLYLSEAEISGVALSLDGEFELISVCYSPLSTKFVCTFRAMNQVDYLVDSDGSIILDFNGQPVVMP